MVQMLWDALSSDDREVIIALCVCGGRVSVSLLTHDSPEWWRLSDEQQFDHAVTIPEQPVSWPSAALLGEPDAIPTVRRWCSTELVVEEIDEVLPKPSTTILSTEAKFTTSMNISA